MRKTFRRGRIDRGLSIIQLGEDIKARNKVKSKSKAFAWLNLEIYYY